MKIVLTALIVVAIMQYIAKNYSSSNSIALD
jgi:hypothetical protein